MTTRSTLAGTVLTVSVAFLSVATATSCATALSTSASLESSLDAAFPGARIGNGESELGAAARFFEAWSARFRSHAEPDDVSLEIVADDAQILHVEVGRESVTWQRLLGADWKQRLRESRTWQFFFGDNVTPFARKRARGVCSYATLSRAGYVRVECRDAGERFLLRRLGNGWRIVERTVVTCADDAPDARCRQRRRLTTFLCRVVGEGCPPR